MAMWKSFLTSMGLLTIALASALYSSGAGRDGRIVGAVVSALIALGIAVWVGIQFVPRLASHVDWKWLPIFSQYRVTREGCMYFVTVGVVLFAAINTANNLLYMVLSALLAVLILSGFLSALNFRFVRTIVRIPSSCYAGEAFPINLQVQNDKRFFPTFSLSIAPLPESEFRFSTVYVPVIPGTQQFSRAAQGIFRRRGSYVVRELRASSRYPFGFLLKHQKHPVDAECICYPEITPLEQMDFAGFDHRGSSQAFERGSGHDLYMIRDYLPSDSARHVHWKASAKTSVLKTREYAAEHSSRAILVFDRFGNSDDAERFEGLVSRAASLAFHLINSGVEVKFVTDELESSVLEEILEYLAVVEMSRSAGPPWSEDATVKLSLRR
jgi:uncharacterized protein (DUF58 family)